MSKSTEIIAKVFDTPLEQMENEYKLRLTGVRDNFDLLVDKVKDIVTYGIEIPNQEYYDKAIELKRFIKAIHVDIKKEGKDQKAPILKLGRQVDVDVDDLREPFQAAEQIVRAKMEEFEQMMKKKKSEGKSGDALADNESAAIEASLVALNELSKEINKAQSVEEVDAFERALYGIDLSLYKSRSDEAGFIVGTLKNKCADACKTLPKSDSFPPINQEILDRLIPNLKAPFEDGAPSSSNNGVITINKSDWDRPLSDHQMRLLNLYEDYHKAGFEASNSMEWTESNEPEEIDETEPNDGELDFGSVAEQQKEARNAPKEVIPEKRFFTPEQVDKFIHSSVLPIAISYDEDPEKVFQVLTVNAYAKPYDRHGFPNTVELGVEDANKLSRVKYLAKYQLIDVMRIEPEASTEEE